MKNLMKNSVVGNSLENVRKRRDIRLVKTIKRTNYTMSEPNYRWTKWVSEIY